MFIYIRIICVILTYNFSKKRHVRLGEVPVINNKNKSALSKWPLINPVPPDNMLLDIIATTRKLKCHNTLIFLRIHVNFEPFSFLLNRKVFLCVCVCFCPLVPPASISSYAFLLGNLSACYNPVPPCQCAATGSEVAL